MLEDRFVGMLPRHWKKKQIGVDTAIAFQSSASKEGGFESLNDKFGKYVESKNNFHDFIQHLTRCVKFIRYKDVQDDLSLQRVTSG